MIAEPQCVSSIDVPVNVKDRLSLDGFLSAGMQEGETELVEEEAPGKYARRNVMFCYDDIELACPAILVSNEPEVNEAAVAHLMEMGFLRIRCVKGLLATGNGSADAAMDWLIMHMEDPGKPIRMSGLSRNHKLNSKLLVWLDPKDIDDPLPAAGTKASTNAGPEPSAEQIEQLSMMGFTAAQSKKALRLTVSPQGMKHRNDVPTNLLCVNRITTPREPSTGCSLILMMMDAKTTSRWQPYQKTRTSEDPHRYPPSTASKPSSRTKDRRYIPATMSLRSDKRTGAGCFSMTKRWSRRRARRTRR